MAARHRTPRGRERRGIVPLKGALRGRFERDDRAARARHRRRIPRAGPRPRPHPRPTDTTRPDTGGGGPRAASASASAPRWLDARLGHAGAHRGWRGDAAGERRRSVLGLVGHRPLGDRVVWIDYREQVVAMIQAASAGGITLAPVKAPSPAASAASAIHRWRDRARCSPPRFEARDPGAVPSWSATARSWCTARSPTRCRPTTAGA